jgi:exodeoxyribonuclease III
VSYADATRTNVPVSYADATRTNVPVRNTDATRTNVPVSYADATRTNVPVSDADVTRTNVPVSDADATRTNVPVSDADATRTNVPVREVDATRTAGDVGETGVENARQHPEIVKTINTWETKATSVQKGRRSLGTSRSQLKIMRLKVKRAFRASLCCTATQWDTRNPLQDLTSLYGAEYALSAWPKKHQLSEGRMNARIWIHGDMLWSIWIIGQEHEANLVTLESNATTTMQVGTDTWITGGMCEDTMSVRCNPNGRVMAGCIKIDEQNMESGKPNKEEVSKEGVLRFLDATITKLRIKRLKREARRLRQVTSMITAIVDKERKVESSSNKSKRKRVNRQARKAAKEGKPVTKTHSAKDTQDASVEDNKKRQKQETMKDEVIKRIISWNVNSIRQAHKKGFFLETLKTMDADVVLLQEVRGAEDRIYKSKGLMQGLRDLGYRYFYWNVCADVKLGTGYSGVAVISKFPMERVEVGLGGEDVEGRVLTVYHKDFVITTAYTPCSQLSGLECTRGEIRKNFDIDLKTHILRKKAEVDSEGKHRTFILMGDLNVARKEGDCWLSKKRQQDWPGCRPHEREALENIIKECQLEDMAWKLHGLKSKHTWFKSWWCKSRGQGMRLDYALVSKDKTKEMGFEVASEAKGSDHQPIILNIKARTEQPVEREPTRDIDQGEQHPIVPEPDMFPQLTSLMKELNITNKGPLVAEMLGKMNKEKKKSKNKNKSELSCNLMEGNTDDIMEDHYICSVTGKCTKDVKNKCPYTMGRTERRKRAKERSGKFVRMPVLDAARVDGNVCKTLCDTGSTYELARRGFLIDTLGPRAYKKRLIYVKKNDLPQLITASGAHTSPIGKIQVCLEVCKGIFLDIWFWVMDAMPIDFIIGCVHMDEKGWCIDYDGHEIRMGKRANEDAPWVKFSYETSVRLYETDGVICVPEEITLQPGEAQRITARCDTMSLKKGTPINGMVTRIREEVQTRTAESLNVMIDGDVIVDLCNTTDVPVVIRAGSAVGVFNPMMLNDGRYEVEKLATLLSKAETQRCTACKEHIQKNKVEAKEERERTHRNNINKGCCERPPSTASDLCAHIHEDTPDRAHHPDATHNIKPHTHNVNVVIENGKESGPAIIMNHSDQKGTDLMNKPGRLTVPPGGTQTQSQGEHPVLESNSSHINTIHEYMETLTDCDTHVHNSNTTHLGSSAHHTDTTALKGLRRVSEDGSSAQAKDKRMLGFRTVPQSALDTSPQTSTRTLPGQDSHKDMASSRTTSLPVPMGMGEGYKQDTHTHTHKQDTHTHTHKQDTHTHTQKQDAHTHTQKQETKHDWETMDISTLDAEFATDKVLKELKLVKTMCPGLTDKEFDIMRRIMYKYKDILVHDEFEAGQAGADQGWQVEIELKDGQLPHIHKQYRLNPVRRQWFECECQKLVADGSIEECDSAWNNRVVFHDKEGKKTRMCLDLKDLNLKIKNKAYALPRISDTLDCMGGAKYFSVFDMRSGYFNLKLAEESRDFTAFQGPTAQYRYKVLPFGVMTGPAIFQRLAHSMLGKLAWTSVLCYMDDLCVFSKTFSDHMEHYEQLFTKLRKYKFKLGANKAQFCKETFDFLGHRISADGVSCDPKKADALKNAERPKGIKQLRSFLGSASYFRKFIKGFSTIAAPLTALLREGGKVISKTKGLQGSALEAYDTLMKALCSAPVLMHPMFDRPFQIHCDASNVGIGSVLLQKDDDGNLRVVHYISRSLNDHERSKYSIMEKECLAVVWALKSFRPYVLGMMTDMKIEVKTDNESLVWLTRQKEPMRLRNWLVMIQEYSLNITHIKGALNILPDHLSRYPPSDADTVKKEEYGCMCEEDSDDETFGHKGNNAIITPEQTKEMRRVANSQFSKCSLVLIQTPETSVCTTYNKPNHDTIMENAKCTPESCELATQGKCTPELCGLVIKGMYPGDEPSQNLDFMSQQMTRE